MEYIVKEVLRGEQSNEKKRGFTDILSVRTYVLIR